MEDAPILFLKKHRNPATKEGKRTYLKYSEQHVDHANVAGTALRALRLLKRDFTSDSDPEPSPAFFELSPSTPWTKYGDRFKAGVQQYGGFSIHVELDRKGRPVLLILGAMNNVTLAVKLWIDGERSPWSSFEHRYPQLAKIIADDELIKLTTSYQLTRRFLNLRRPRHADKLVDALLLGNILRNDDFFHAKRYADCDERLASLCLIWSILGEHKGPITFRDWEAAFGNGVPFPARRKEDRLLRWPKTHRREDLTRSQVIYAEQLSRAANTVGVHFLLWNANYAEMTRPIDDFGNTFEGCLDRSYGESLTHGYGWMAQYQGVRENFVRDPSSSPSPPPTRRVRFVAPDVDDYEPSIPRPVASPRQDLEPDNDQYDPEIESTKVRSREREVQMQDPFAGSDSDDVHEGPSHSSPAASTSGASNAPPTGLDPPRPGPDPPRFRPREGPSRPDSDRQKVTIPTRAARNKRMEINRKRHKYRVDHSEEFNEDFVGKNACIACSDEPRHQDPDECPVEYFRKYGKMPKQCSLPCHYCDSFEHITDACEFLHVRCVVCGYRGHMAFECHERNTEEWLVAYLNCVHLGKWTRRNPDGPIRGRFGFGDTSEMTLSNSTKQLIGTKRNSLRFARHKEATGQPTCDSARDVAASWDQLRRQEVELQRREREVERKQQAIYREEDRAKRESRLGYKRRAVERQDTTTQTGDSDDLGKSFVVLNLSNDQPSPDKIHDNGDRKSPKPKERAESNEEPMQDDVLELHVEEYFV